jgi:hypothetical protein
MMAVEMEMMMMAVAIVVITIMLVVVMVMMVTDECLSVERYIQSKIQSLHAVNSTVKSSPYNAPFSWLYFRDLY